MINFDDSNWNELRTNYRKWWDNELGRPILPIVFWGIDPKRDKPKNPLLGFENSYDFSITPQQIIDRYDYEVSCFEYAGEAFPSVSLTSFGAGVSAAFLGSEYHSVSSTVWFDVKKILPIKELHFEYNPNNRVLQRVKEIYEVGMEKWRGDVVMQMVDLGGVMDILASFRTGENLLTDLYDEPEEVLRCVNEIQTMWLKFYDEINKIVKPYAKGYSSWDCMYYEKPSYIMQSDFSYMIGPDMFDRFVAPELSSTGKHLDKAFYHLDGIGEIPHLDTLLATESVKGIQWVPGDGEPVTRDWSDLYAKIGRSGKKIQAHQGLDYYLDSILKVIPCPDLLVKAPLWFSIDQKDEVRRKVEKYGLEIL